MKFIFYDAFCYHISFNFFSTKFIDILLNAQHGDDIFFSFENHVWLSKFSKRCHFVTDMIVEYIKKKYVRKLRGQIIIIEW